MGRKRHTCNCYGCAEVREDRQELQHGGLDWETDEEALTPYRKPSRSNFNHRRNRACKKSKTGEQCIFSDKKVIGTKWMIDRETGKRYASLNEISACARCGKHGSSSWGTWYF